jgi:hypothetical protein
MLKVSEIFRLDLNISDIPKNLRYLIHHICGAATAWRNKSLLKYFEKEEIYIKFHQLLAHLLEGPMEAIAALVQEGIIVWLKDVKEQRDLHGSRRLGLVSMVTTPMHLPAIQVPTSLRVQRLTASIASGTEQLAGRGTEERTPTRMVLFCPEIFCLENCDVLCSNYCFKQKKTP